jgi:hypothetical protein
MRLRRFACGDLILLFQKAGAFPSSRVVLHVEPDFWGYMEQRASGDNAATVAAKVSETGVAVLQGLPSTVSGFAQAIIKLRDVYSAERNARLSRQRVGNRHRHRVVEPARRDRRRTRRAGCCFLQVAQRQVRSRFRRVQRS